MMIKNIAISEIVIREDRARPIDMEVVESLAKNIKENGLINPIMTTQDKVLIAGNHRLEAFKINNESVIPCHILELSYDDSKDKVKILELSENAIRNDLTLSEKFEVYKEIRKLRDARKENGGNDTRKIDLVPIGTESISLEEYNKRAKQKKAEDAKESGFKNATEARRVSAIVNNAIPAVIEALDKGSLAVYGADKIQKLPKEKQKEALDKYLRGSRGKPSIDGVQASKAKNEKIKKMDKHGRYAEIKLYTHTPKETAKNIAKYYGSGLKEPYTALLVEMCKILSGLDNPNIKPIEPDLYKLYSYGMTSVSDGDILEIKELLNQGILSHVAIAEEFDVSIFTIKKIAKLEL